MTIPLRLEALAEPLPTTGALLQQDYLLPAEPRSEARPELSTAELAFRIFAAFRAHPHINNVLTRISRAKSGDVEHALNRILDLSTTSEGVSPLEENIVDLMAGERGITGKILKPYFQAALLRIVEPSRAERLIRHVNALYLELEWKVQHPLTSASTSHPPQESDHARSEPQ